MILISALFLAGNVCDGQTIKVTDGGIDPNSNADQTAALSAFIKENTGKVILFPSGSYHVSGLTISNDVVLRGEKGAVLQGTDKGKPVLFLGNGNISLKNIIVDGANMANVGIFIFSYNNNILIDSCEIKNVMGDDQNGGYGIQVNRNEQMVRILNSVVHDIDGPEDNITGNRVGANRGIFINNVNSVLVEKCTFENIKGFEDGDCIHCYRWDKKVARAIIIRNNVFKNVYKRAVKVQVNNVAIIDNVIESNNTSDFNYAAISYFGNNGLIADNKITLSKTVYGIELNGCKNITVENNQISITAFKYKGNSGILFKDVEEGRNIRNSFSVPDRNNILKIGNNKNISEQDNIKQQL